MDIYLNQGLNCIQYAHKNAQSYESTYQSNQFL